MPLSALARLVAPLAPPLCVACGAWAGALEPLCADCRGRLRWLGSTLADCGGLPVWAPVAYDGPARALVRALKFGGARATVAAMAAQIAANAPPGLLAGALVPVPAHPARRRRRGYDQAGLLAAALGERASLPVRPCLARAGPDVPQVGRPRAARLAGPVGHVRLAPGARAPRAAVLVDDVVTTGATFAACAAALRAGGAASVAAVAYARTPAR